MSPDGSDFLATDGLPDVLPVADIRSGKEHRVPGRYDFIRDRGFFTVDLPSEEQQHRKTDDHYGGKADPESVCFHIFSPFVY
jgi:hypothetical protein